MVDKAKTSGVERMLDPIGDRVVKDVARPPRYPMSTEKLYHTVSKSTRPVSVICLANQLSPPHATNVTHLQSTE